MMNWEKLLSLQRYGDKERGYKRPRIKQNETRLDFEVDYDRIVFSAPFRSLQDKTQVIPLSKNAFVHTRLTHSMEVSVVGRSIGRKVGSKILEKHSYLQKLGYKFGDFGAIVASAALAHDIGNPPFGHSGEKAISSFFKFSEGSQIKRFISEKEYQDLCSFEGNANGFRILTQSRKGVEGGLRLTYATLGAFIKYPKESLPVKPTSNIADKKYGFFQSEKEFAKELLEDLGILRTSSVSEEIRFARHPLTFLVEAADDICYTIIDFEDGINLGLIPEDLALKYLSELVDKNINRKKYNQLTTKEDRIAYLRALAIGALIDSVCEVFLENESSILNGNFHQSLLDKSIYAPQIKNLLKISAEKIYRSEEVVEKEIAGYTIIENILGKYYQAVFNHYKKENTHYNNLILSTIPKRYWEEEKTLYGKMLGISAYVASLTDSKAVELHHKIIGFL